MSSAFVPSGSDPRFLLIRCDAAAADFGDDVRAGLTAPRKWLPPRWFYDEVGSALFDTICFLPEYYVMRSEAEVLTGHAREIANAFGDDCALVELGSGMARKTRILLDVLTAHHGTFDYAPVDVDESVLERSARELLAEYPRLRVTAIRSDFSRPSVPLGEIGHPRARTIVLFLGSTIGNLDPAAAVAMLRDLRRSLRKGDALFLGADLQKPREILEPAYDDALGVTAAFNRNLLQRINRELGGHFDLETFTHRALWNEPLGRIEMHLESRIAQRVTIDALDLEVSFAAGESIHTESSYKHTRETLADLARQSGFRIEQSWTDPRGWFADVLMVGC